MGDSKRISVGIPYTIPLPRGTVDSYGRPITEIGYMKGSAPWLVTQANALSRSHFEVVAIGPAYEGLPYQKYRDWRVLPINYTPPEFDPAYQTAYTWRPVRPEMMHVSSPILAFTRGGIGYSVTCEAGAPVVRAVLEATRFQLDWAPLLQGRQHFDVIFPQHILMNAIAGAHYAAFGKAVWISHETDVRNNPNDVGGWNAVNLHPYVLSYFDPQRGQTRVIAISPDVENMLVEEGGGPRFPRDRVEMISNPYDETAFYPMMGVDKKQFLEDVRQQPANVPLFEGVSTKGNWAIWVGRTSEFKGVEQALRLWSIYHRADPARTENDVLFMVGPGLEASSEFAKYAEELGIGGKVRFLGGRTPDFINRFYNAADLALMTSLREGDGVVGKQPGGANRRVVVADSGGPARYMTEQMGQKVVSRDPDRVESLERGLELLSGRRSIQWGDIALSGSEIIGHYMRWRQVYEIGTKDEATLLNQVQRDRLLRAVANDWDTPTGITVRRFAEEQLAWMKKSRETGIKSDRPFVPMGPRPAVNRLVEVFTVYGGMDVEANAFADAVSEEFSYSPEQRAARNLAAGAHVRNQWSSDGYGRKLSPLLKEAANRPFDLSTLPPPRWHETVVAQFQPDDQVAKAFRVWEQANNYGDFLISAAAFHTAIMQNLGNPANYPEEWPSPARLAMQDPRRTSAVVARVADLPDPDMYEAQKERLIQEVAAHPALQDALSLLHRDEEIDPAVMEQLYQCPLGQFDDSMTFMPASMMATSGVSAFRK